MAEKNYWHLENKARRQHYVTVLIGRLSGWTSEQIAASLKMEARSVERDLEYVRKNWSIIFAPGDDPTPYKKSPTTSLWKTRAVCCACRSVIEAGAERVLVGAFELTNKIDTGDADYRRNGRTVSQEIEDFEGMGVASSRFLHCCVKCSLEVPDFRIGNPAFVEEHLRSKAEMRESVEIEPPNPEGQVEASDPQTTSAPRAVDGDQKSMVDKFLKDPRSRGMRPESRRVATMWVSGLNQNEIAVKMNIHQASVSRMIKIVKNMAYAPA
jgi:hypothetical protein